MAIVNYAVLRPSYWHAFTSFFQFLCLFRGPAVSHEFTGQCQVPWSLRGAGRGACEKQVHTVLHIRATNVRAPRCRKAWLHTLLGRAGSRSRWPAGPRA